MNYVIKYENVRIVELLNSSLPICACVYCYDYFYAYIVCFFSLRGQSLKPISVSLFWAYCMTTMAAPLRKNTL